MLYAVFFTVLFVALVPMVFGYQVSIYESKHHVNGIESGSLIMAKRTNVELEDRDLILIENQTYSQQTLYKVDDFNKVEGGPSLHQNQYDKYMYHIPYVGSVVEVLKIHMTSFLMGAILLLLLTYVKWKA